MHAVHESKINAMNPLAMLHTNDLTKTQNQTKVEFSFPTPLKCRDILSFIIQLLTNFPKMENIKWWSYLHGCCDGLVDYEVVCEDQENAENAEIDEVT
jgi:hypothetical protein